MTFWYPLFLTILTLINNVRQWSNRKKCILLAWLFCFISCIRYGMSYDYFIYTKFIVHDFHHRELIPSLIEIIAHYTHPQIFFIITSIIITCCFTKPILRYSRNPLISFFFYIGFPIFYFTGLSTVRQTLASSFVFLALLIEDSEKRAFLKKSILLIIACLCHTSALLCLILLLPLRRVSLRTLKFLVFICMFVGSAVGVVLPLIVSGGYIGDKVNQYFFELDQTGHNFERMICNAITIAIMIKQSILVNMNQRNKYFISLVYIGAIFLGLFSVSNDMSIRCFGFFASPLLLLIPDILKVYHINGGIFKIACICLLIASIYVPYIYTDPTIWHFYPFTAFWDLPIMQVFTDTELAN